VFGELAQWWARVTPVELVWLGIGLGGQLMFSARWIIQWIASERMRRSIVPETFWYLSLVGGLLVLTYGIWKREPVIILGQFGVFIYARNIYFLLTSRQDGSAGTSPDQPPGRG
jgi:lipid-A-disaccharide synthase-like uncharacterized protein